jgi:hypothetical protein
MNAGLAGKRGSSAAGGGLPGTPPITRIDSSFPSYTWVAAPRSMLSKRRREETIAVSPLRKHNYGDGSTVFSFSNNIVAA